MDLSGLNKKELAKLFTSFGVNNPGKKAEELTAAKGDSDVLAILHELGLSARNVGQREIIELRRT